MYGPGWGWYGPPMSYGPLPQPEDKQSLKARIKEAKSIVKALEDKQDKKKKGVKDKPLGLIHQSMMLMMFAPFLGITELLVIKYVLETLKH